jgi:hypothetical protein
LKEITQIIKYIDWYINISESAMGISSSFYAMVNSSPGKPPSVNPEKIIFFLPKIRKHRIIHKALQDLSKEDLRKISALYSDDYKNSFPVIIRNVFEDKIGLALCLFYDMDKLESLCLKHRHKSLSTEEDKILNDLIKLTKNEYDRLHYLLKHLQKELTN